MRRTNRPQPPVFQPPEHSHRPRRILLAASVLCSMLSAAGALTAQVVAPPTVTIQQPVFGVAVDADGVLSRKTFTDPGGRLRAERLAAAARSLPADVLAPSKLRKVSLIRLERAIEARLRAGEPLDEPMQYLAGLQRLQFVFFYPDERDLVIAGPAEGWVPDASGRVVGMRSGGPVLRLDDLVVALRAYPPQGPAVPWLGCSIGPTAEAYERLRAFQRTIPRTIRDNQRAAVTAWIANGVRGALGDTVISVYGISPETHFAQVLVEADYRMKLIGIGLEPPPVDMPTYMSALKTARHGAFLRWWFTPNYECVKASDDGLAMELVGQGVQLLGEHMALQPDGTLAAAPGAQPTRPSRIFTDNFTHRYPEIAAASPVYAELRNLIDLSVAAAFIRQRDYYSHADWPMTTFTSEEALPTQTEHAAKTVPAAVNVVWKGSRLLAPGGGVSIQPAEALSRDRLAPDADGAIREQHTRVRAGVPAEAWWWD